MTRGSSAISLGSHGRVLLFLLLVAVPAFLFVTEAARIVLAQRLSEGYEAAKLQQAIALDPANPELRYRLGTLYLLGRAGDPAKAMRLLREATELNPNRAEYWLGLARGCLSTGDQGCARQGFEQAVQLAPMRPALQLETAAYYAVAGDPAPMLAHLRRLLELNPGSANVVFALTWRAFDDPALVWQGLIGPLQGVDVKCSYLDFLAEKKRFDLTSQYWGETAGTAKGMSFPLVKPYLQHLLEAQQYEQAAAVWHDLLTMGVVRSGEASLGLRGFSRNLVFNASFAQPILNAGFDWQAREQNYVALDFGKNVRIDFTVAHNTDDEPLYQLIPVMPNHEYLLTANTRSEAITSDSGPCLRVVDLRCPRCLDVTTEAAVGTRAWHEVQRAFSTGPQTTFIRLSIWRPRSRSFPMDISGRAWFADISLHQIQADGPQLAPRFAPSRN